MDIDILEKTELPVYVTTDIMPLLIKAKHFFFHALLHAQQGSNFDIMISIHSLDNSIEYVLRIIIKHLKIEEKLSKTINTAELMGLYGEVDKFLKEHTMFEGKPTRLPFENEIRQLRGLRNNVQHGLILPISELRELIKYGNSFFEKVLIKIFGITMQEIAYSSLIENEEIKKFIVIAESKMASNEYLETIVACRDAFELAQFMFQNNSHHINKMMAMPHIKKDSIELYFYLQYIDEEMSMLGTHIDIPSYRLFKRYLEHIPSQYRAVKSGYTVMQRAWEKRDSDFCYAFTSEVILNWQANQQQPLYDIDLSSIPSLRRDYTINGVFLPEIYPDKRCMYIGDNDSTGELLYIDGETKEKLGTIAPNDICRLTLCMSDMKTGLKFKEYTEFIVIDVVDVSLVLNSSPLWELVIYYRKIPFTTIEEFDDELIDIDTLTEISSSTQLEEKVTRIIKAYLADNENIARQDIATELHRVLVANNVEYDIRSKLYSSKLISELENSISKQNQ